MRNRNWLMRLCSGLCLGCAALRLQAGEAAAVETRLTDRVTRLEYADGTVRLDVAGRGSQNPVTLVPAAVPEGSEPVPTRSEQRRGYALFVPVSGGGVLPAYRPMPAECTDRLRIWASPGEFEPATLCVRPLRDLGTVRFEVGPVAGRRGVVLAGAGADLYVLQPTVEQIKLTDDRCRWVPKWLRPTDVAPGGAYANIQVVADVSIPADAPPGRYRLPLTVRPEQGRATTVTVELEVLPLRLDRPMAWGFYQYNWNDVETEPEPILRTLREMHRAGMTQCVISPIHYQNRVPVEADGSVDFGLYDACVKLYQEAGFEDPPILAMEGLLFSICGALGKIEELKFSNHLLPGVKAAEFPTDIREFAGRIVRRLYDHGLEANWPSFYAYFADEPSTGSAKMEKAKFMFGLAREVAPELQIACGLYTHEWWRSLGPEMIDLNIVHYVHPCHNAGANRRWHELADAMGARLYGIDFIGPLDSFWQGRQITLTAEKGGLAGMMCWTQWLIENIDGSEPFDPYRFLANTWKGGPWCLRERENGAVWRSFAWLGLREGIDDSRYLRTARNLAAEAERSLDPARREQGAAAARQIAALMDRVAWVPDVRRADATYTNRTAADVRRGLAELAVALQAQ